MADTPDDHKKSDKPVPKGVWRDPFDLGHTLIPPEIQQQLKERFESKSGADYHMQQLLDQGWRRQSEIAGIIGDKQSTLSAKLAYYHNDKTCTPAGIQPSGLPDEVLVKGSELRWQHPIKKVTLLRPELAQGLIVAEDKYKHLVAENYKLQSDFIKRLSVPDVQIYGRTAKVQENEFYLTNGQKPQGIEGEQVIKGDLLRWQHPYRRQVVLLHPDYATALASEVQSKVKPKKIPTISREEADHEMERLLGTGWLLQNEVANSMAMAPKKLARKTRYIEPNSDYFPDGRKSEGIDGEQTVKGTQLRWQHPYGDKKVLLSKEYSQALITAEKEEQKLIAKGYRLSTEITKEGQIDSVALAQRNRTILPNGYYLLNGLTPANDSTEEKIIGSQLYWRHPLDRKTVLIHPDYAKALLSAAEKYRSLKTEGYQLQSEISEGAMVTTRLRLAARTRAIDPDKNYLSNGHQPSAVSGEIVLKGAQLRWQHPYDKDSVLLHPDLAKNLQQEFALRDQTSKDRLATLIPRAEADRIQQQLLEKKYRLISEVAKDCEIDRRKLSQSTLKTTKDSQLRWVHPYTKDVFLHPDFAESLVAAERKVKELESQQYELQSKIEKETGMRPTSLTARTSRIKPEKDYLTNGLKPTGIPGEITIKGAELRWQHPHNEKVVLLHPDYVVKLRERAKQKQENGGLKDQSHVSTVVSKGSVSQSVGTARKESLPKEITAALDAKEAAQGKQH